ncbi:unnamed protein product [Auanema sp. JU1783]|nr:unnamed protein product [Auanema sp. JU1783]
MFELPSFSPSTCEFLNNIERAENGLSEEERKTFKDEMNLSISESLKEFEIVFEQVSTPLVSPTTEEPKQVTSKI